MGSRKYRYDFHVHTSEASKCGKISGAEVAALYASLGYDGFVVTDHFFNGNTRIDKTLSWEERVDLYLSGYEAARDAGEALGLDVFFGAEASFAGNEILTYGIDREFLLAHPDLDLYTYHEYCDAAHEYGAFLSQAHPFRERGYIRDMRLFIRGEVDAFEVVNAAHSAECMEFDRRADFIADSCHLLKTAGSDTHFTDRPYFAGLEFEHRISTQSELVEALRSGEGRVFVTDNTGKEIDIYARSGETHK